MTSPQDSKTAIPPVSNWRCLCKKRLLLVWIGVGIGFLGLTGLPTTSNGDSVAKLNSGQTGWVEDVKAAASARSATVMLDSDLPPAAGVQHLYTITHTSNGAATGRWQCYRDGDTIAWVDGAYPLSALQDVNNWLGR